MLFAQLLHARRVSSAPAVCREAMAHVGRCPLIGATAGS